MRPVQYFTPEYLKECKKMSPEDRLQFLEDFRKLQDRRPPAKSKLISLRIDEALLERFREKAKAAGLPYQTLLKNLIRDFLAR
ncbi:MAG TPA: CopG family antitoxin [bacterium]|nr:CopG family antitoxin [bacterium]